MECLRNANTFSKFTVYSGGVTGALRVFAVPENG